MFKSGMIVFLRSGSPPLRVVCNVDGRIWCCWQDGDIKNLAEFPEACLTTDLTTET
jgi:hypothetical protein